MNTNAASSTPSSRRRNKTNRRQYQSCDQCRKGRRACDAFNFAIDTISQSDLTNSSQTWPLGCSGCQKFNKQCTFEWLRSIPPQVLRRRLNTKSQLSEQILCEQPGFDNDFSSADPSPSHNAQQSERTDTGTGFNGELDLDSGVDEFLHLEDVWPLANDYQLGSMFQPSLSGQPAAVSFSGAAYDSASLKLIDQSGSSRDQFQGAPTEESGGPAVWVPNDDRIDERYGGAGHDQIFETPWGSGIYPPTQFDPRMPIPTIDPIQATLLEDQDGLFELEYLQNKLGDPSSGRFPTITSPWGRTVDVDSLTNRVTTQQWPILSMQEHWLTDKSNKIAISNDLMKIYCDSLENALECWMDRGTCPYKIETDVALRLRAVKKQTRPPSGSKTFYNRVYTLDTVFSRQRPRLLTTAEDSGSSKALRLAIMAFACQWSQSSGASPKNVHETNWPLSDACRTDEPRPIPNFEAADAQEFERLLRLSIWHESQRCISRWNYCGSFRVIFASIILFCSQQPLDEDELIDFHENHLEPLTTQDLGAEDFLQSSLGYLGDQLNSSGPFSNATSEVLIDKSIPDLKLFSSSFYSHEGLEHLDIGLRHLLDWRKSIMSSYQQKRTFHAVATEAPSTGNALPGSQYLSDFNLIFWLGVMCDTTSCVLNQRALVIPDSETFTRSDGKTRSDLDWIPDVDQNQPAERLTQSVDIWGSYLLDADRIWRRSLVAAKDPPVFQLEPKMIQLAVPLKLLFWRKVGKLQNMISSCGWKTTSILSPTEVENAIKEALGVHQYWSVNYGELFAACLREHSNLPTQSQSWYLVLVLGWNLACIVLARYIDFVDRNDISERLGQRLRSSSALTNEMKKTGVYAIAEAARVCSYLPTNTSSISAEEDTSSATGRSSTTKTSHHALLGQSPLLWDPHTEKVVKALEMASEILLGWLQQWRSPAADDCLLHLSWLHTNTSSDEISRHCVDCINALDLLKSKSDVARLTTEHLIMRYNLLKVANPSTTLEYS